MTLTTLVTLNAILTGILVYGIVWLLGFGIHSDRLAGEQDLRLHLPTHEADRMAA
jgi:hypothetical protein